MAALDRDHDQVLSAEEIDQAATTLRKLDRDGDGKLSGDELRPAGAPDGRPQPENDKPQDK